jgi:hypothetical protein
LTLVRTHLCYGSEIWAPQTTSRDLLCLESVQRRATKYILQDFTSSYTNRLKKLNLLPISYWFEIKDITFFYKCKAGYYDLTLEDYILDNSILIITLALALLIDTDQTVAEHLLSETYFSIG